MREGEKSSEIQVVREDDVSVLSRPFHHCDIRRIWRAERGPVNSFEARINISAIYGQLRQFDKSELFAREAIRIRPDSAEAYHNLGVALAAQGKMKEAVFALGRAVKYAPENQRYRELLDEARRKSGLTDESGAGR